MQKTGLLWVLIFVFLTTGCVKPTFDRQDSALIVFKTPTFRYADMGFIYQSEDALKVEIYSSGQVLTSFMMQDGQICMSALKCMGAAKFNAEVLSRYYPESLLGNVFKGEYIFDKEGVKKSRNGFTQKIFKSRKYDISYSVLNGQIVFRDTINNILIKVKRNS